jgi:hypothetical protein
LVCLLVFHAYFTGDFRLTARRLYKSFGVKGLISTRVHISEIFLPLSVVVATKDKASRGIHMGGWTGCFPPTSLMPRLGANEMHLFGTCPRPMEWIRMKEYRWGGRTMSQGSTRRPLRAEIRDLWWKKKRHWERFFYVIIPQRLRLIHSSPTLHNIRNCQSR